MSKPWLRNVLTAAALMMAPSVAAALGPSPVTDGPGRSFDFVPNEMEGIGVDEKRDAQIPLNLAFTNEMGKPVMLRELMDGRPVLLQLGYYECPMLCDLVAHGWVESIAGIENLRLGKDFNVISISISPEESHKVAAMKKQSFLRTAGKPIPPEAVHYLVGSKNNIEAIAEATGYRYKYLPAARQYSHPAVVIVLTPEGRISQYLYGVKYEPKDLEAAIRDASAGRVGSPMEQILMTCARLTQHAGGPLMIMRIGGVLTVLVLGGIIVRQVLRDKKSNESEDHQPAKPSAASWN